ncbi:beta-Amyrin Synthase 2-like [Hibiscus syriacus]|uniref:Beta-Amyrin Synthase 2-like n=1 Tax=Hibiscus syriacus TaxID=106335 RepID=A0A6A3CKI7_HIBSY|nr:beta-Amyrin Synthase 2-like [Hibiscus syriacus]
MWRLKVGEGGNNPYIFSTNKFLGGQTWEFDPNAGIAEERAEVEEARTNFYNNRNNVQPSSDLLWQLQPDMSWDYFLAWASSAWKGKSLLTTILKIIWCSFIYYVWEERNRCLFQGRVRTIDDLLFSIKEIVSAQLRNRDTNSLDLVNMQLMTNWGIG